MPESISSKRQRLRDAARRAGLTAGEAERWIAEQMRPPTHRTPEDDAPPRQLFGGPAAGKGGDDAEPSEADPVPAGP